MNWYHYHIKYWNEDKETYDDLYGFVRAEDIPTATRYIVEDYGDVSSVCVTELNVSYGGYCLELSKDAIDEVIADAEKL